MKLCNAICIELSNFDPEILFRIINHLKDNTMKKIFFIITFAIAGSFGTTSAQVEQSTTTTTERKSTTYENENESTSPNMQDTKQDETKKKGLFKKKNQSTSQNERSTGTQGKYDGSSTGSSGTGSTTGTGSSTNTEGTYQQGTGTSGTYQQGTGTSESGTGTSGTYQQGTTTTPQDRTRTDETYNQSMGMSSEDEEGWTKIGEKTINLSKDRDEVTVSGSEKFSSIKIKVSDAAMIDVEDVEVEYEGGEKQTVEMDTPINTSTGESKVIDLESSDQNVKKITFEYKKRATWTDKDATDTRETIGDAMDKVTKVEVWGLKADTALK